LHRDSAQGYAHHLLDGNEDDRKPRPAHALKFSEKKYDAALVLRWPWASWLEQLGLEEQVPGTSDRRNTLLGRELHFDLLMVFLGLWDEWEIPGILEDHGLIDDLEAQHMQDLLQAGRDPEIALKEYVREAYFKYYKTTKLVN
jgi:hypothetical protein